MYKDIGVWLTNELATECNTRKRKKIKDTKIINPFFRSMSDSVKHGDVYWGNILLSCAKGSFPRNFFLSNDILMYGKTTKRKEFILSSDSARAADQCILIFKKYNQLYSEKDRKRNKMRENVISSMEYTWQSIRSKTKRFQLIYDYVMNKYRDDPRELKYRIYDILCLGIEYKSINNTMITFENKKIMNIEGIMIEDGTVSLIRDTKPVSTYKKKTLFNKGYVVKWGKMKEKMRKNAFITSVV